MGCDIHAYVEYSSDGKYWQNLTKNAGSRNYVMFGVVAGVRVSDAQLFAPKGLPDGELGWATASDYWLRITPAEHPEWANDSGWVSPENAASWVDRGLSQPLRDRDGNMVSVSDPDAHSASWLTASEVSQAVARYREIVGNYWPERNDTIPTEWAMVLGAMKAAEANHAKARVVFWFDN